MSDSEPGQAPRKPKARRQRPKKRKGPVAQPGSETGFRLPSDSVGQWSEPAPMQGGNSRRSRGRGPRPGGAPGGGKRERLNKVLAQSGHGSRRNIDILIAQGHFAVNGEVAVLGSLVGPHDKVTLDGRPLKLKFGDDFPKVLLYHKPEGEIVTRVDPEGRPTVFERLPRPKEGRWVAIGRLDFNTEGLLILTTSGDVANRMMHPRYEIEREYAVRVLGEFTEEARQRLLDGVEIEGELCKFDSVEDRGGEGANHWHHVVLREGKNREVRKMFDALGLTVSRLIRVRYGSVQLPRELSRGEWRELAAEEVKALLIELGVAKPGDPLLNNAAEGDGDPRRKRSRGRGKGDESGYEEFERQPRNLRHTNRDPRTLDQLERRQRYAAVRAQQGGGNRQQRSMIEDSVAAAFVAEAAAARGEVFRPESLLPKPEPGRGKRRARPRGKRRPAPGNAD